MKRKKQNRQLLSNVNSSFRTFSRLFFSVVLGNYTVNLKMKKSRESLLLLFTFYPQSSCMYNLYSHTSRLRPSNTNYHNHDFQFKVYLYSL